ncbi:MAG: insulinase family protein [Bacilli bacterium]|nr:insulinase family protein [Bacilli bacterium]
MTRKFKKIGNVPVQYLITDKFKSLIVSIKFIDHFRMDSINQRALLPNVLTGGSRSLPTRMAIDKELASLYGTDISGSQQKIGEASVISFDMSVINEKYLPQRPEILDRAFSVLSDIIFRPKLIKGSFRKTLFEQEKRLLKEELSTEYHDKFSYGYRQFKNYMFADEMFRFSARGELDTLDDLTLKQINDEYLSMITHDRCEIHVIGDFSEKAMDRLIAKYLQAPDSAFEIDWLDHETRFVNMVRKQHQQSDMTQTRLYIGFRNNIRNTDSLYYPMQIFNIMFGDSDQSRLFQKIREVDQLSYDVSSTYVANKGVLFVFAGIDPGNENAAEVAVFEVLESMKSGFIGSEDLELAKSSFEKRLRQSFDSPSQILQRAFFHQALYQSEYSLEESLAKSKAVTIADVRQAASTLVLDSTFVYGRKAVENDA